MANTLVTTGACPGAIVVRDQVIYEERLFYFGKFICGKKRRST
jgi:hypothetical protein